MRQNGLGNNRVYGLVNKQSKLFYPEPSKKILRIKFYEQKFQ